jgi:hypothetical protein
MRMSMVPILNRFRELQRGRGRKLIEKIVEDQREQLDERHARTAAEQ